MLGKKDKYYSESLVAKAERDVIVDDKFSYGFGREYKYDLGHYTTKTFATSTRGKLSNLGSWTNRKYRGAYTLGNTKGTFDITLN